MFSMLKHWLWSIWVVLVLASAVTHAQEAQTPDEKAARELVQKYLTAVKAKKWAEAKKLLHPKTLEAIAEHKKRLGKEDHPMAPWYQEKVESWLKDFTITSVAPSALGTVVVETSEDTFQVQEKGLAEGEKSAYLVGKKDGKLYVVDRKRGGSFPESSVKIGYKGWFDKVEAPAPD